MAHAYIATYRLPLLRTPQRAHVSLFAFFSTVYFRCPHLTLPSIACRLFLFCLCIQIGCTYTV